MVAGAPAPCAGQKPSTIYEMASGARRRLSIGQTVQGPWGQPAHPLRADRSTVHSGVRLSPRARSIALALALLGSLSAPALALEHGYVHEHVAKRHGGDETPSHGDEPHGEQSADHHPNARQAAPSLASAQRASSSGHAHGHPRLDAAQGARDLIRLPAAHETTAVVPNAVTLHAMLHVVRARPRRPGISGTPRSRAGHPSQPSGPAHSLTVAGRVTALPATCGHAPLLRHGVLRSPPSASRPDGDVTEPCASARGLPAVWPQRHERHASSGQPCPRTSASANRVTS